MEPTFKVISTGPQVLFQDRGRFGLASQGVATSGAFDRHSAARANYAVGNLADAPVLEILVGGFEVEVLRPSMMIFTGTQAEVTITSPDGKINLHQTNCVLDVCPGDRVRLAPADLGLRAYLAVRGGLVCEPVLGSASFDVLSGIGPHPVQVGDELETGAFLTDPSWWPTIRRLPSLWKPSSPEQLTVILGPRTDWFSSEALSAFLHQPYQLTAQSNRVGIRLEGAIPLERSKTGELQSEGMVRGGIQVPPSGHPVVFGPDHPTTGGYPVIAVLTQRSCDRIAQLAPGDTVRFRLPRKSL